MSENVVAAVVRLARNGFADCAAGFGERIALALLLGEEGFEVGKPITVTGRAGCLICKQLDEVIADFGCG